MTGIYATIVGVYSLDVLLEEMMEYQYLNEKAL